ncbi:hypothetical protein Pla163_36120 [Planctomycetes bacterium Pla163]|uniref:Uncharacterized protein n=1 Tax=Rohdeia mirabilis TaxID=2528008 RepID=A0A518D4R1_9BACT|nr:hypothetical protein Pla163_36120 [Planctomycetes bacterium Pla163]
MRLIHLAPLALLCGCANPIYHGSNQNPNGPGPNPAAASSMRGPWGGELEEWATGAPTPIPQTQTPDLGWGRTAPGDRAPATNTGARAVAPGSTGAGVSSGLGSAPSTGYQQPPVDYGAATNTGVGVPNQGRPVVPVDSGAPGTVPGQTPGTTVPMTEPPHTTDPGSSRAHMFEQFQRLEEDREALRLQVAALNGELIRLQNESLQRVELEQRSLEESDSLRAQVERLEEVNRQLSRENEDLAGRLLTAQIRRLEAEKALLENLIQAEQVGGVTRTSGASPTSGSAGGSSAGGAQP